MPGRARPIPVVATGVLVIGAVLGAVSRSVPARVERPAPVSRHDNPSASEDFHRVAPGESDPAPLFSPEDSLKLFKIDPDFEISLAAAEPLVEAPVCMSFDEDGRAWVVEMRGYMRDTKGSTESEPMGRVKVLEDTDGDGVFDKATVFLDKLVMPRAVMPCFGGILVLEPPSLYFCRDTDGDGVCDEKRKLADGLAGENPEHAPNGLLYGLDNWIKLSQSPVEFRFDGEKVVSRKTPAHGQWGISQDDWGRLYYTPNPEALRGDLFPKHYAARNAAQREHPGINELYCRDQTVWPSRPTPGVNRGYMKGILRDDGTLREHTAGCSPLIYRESLLAGCRGDEFMCEPAAFMVRRLKVTETEDGPRARNLYERAELLTSTDERFRPVALTAAPDGSVYVVDMHRGVIQHKTYLTDYLKSQIEKRGLETPVDMGRIYRITRRAGTAPTGSGAAKAARHAREKLSGASTARLVELVSDPDGWWRQTAQRLLVERRAVGAEGPLHGAARRSSEPAARIQALWTLEGLGKLVFDDVIEAMSDRDEHVRAAGVRLSEAWFKGNDDEHGRVLARVREIALRDRRGPALQAALSLGECKDSAALDVLASLAERRGDDRITRGAIVSGLAGRESECLDRVMTRPWLDSPGARAVVADAAECALRSGSAEQRTRVVEAIARSAGSGAADAVPPSAGSEAVFLMQRLRAVIQVESRVPKVLKLAREPVGWAALSSSSGGLARDAAECSFYLDWPGRPYVDPPKRARALTPDEQKRFEQGRGLFAICAGCHGSEGQGTPGQIPPLAGSRRAQGPPQRAIRVLLQGLEGPLTGSAVTDINGSMPVAPFEHDEEIAAVLTYVRQAWGNSGEPVTGEEVAKVRGETRGRGTPWKAEELDAIR